MSRTTFPRAIITYLVATSFIGLIVAGAFVIFPPRIERNFVWRKQLIGSIFVSICILGILAAFFPKQCSRILDFKNEEKSKDSYLTLFAHHKSSSRMKGHHPDCSGFSAHVFRIGNRILCTACTGLVIGGVLALSGAILYFFVNLQVELTSSVLVWVGIFWVGFGLLQFIFEGFFRLLLNMFFPFGAFLILMGVDELRGNITADLFLVAMTLFWLLSRISISQWDHERVCNTCSATPCELHMDKGRR